MSYALLVGINYVGQQGELNGCINDIEDIQELLVKKFNFEEDKVIMLHDNADSDHRPTRRNILRYLVDLATKAAQGHISRLFFHYSGHGYYRRDDDGDENDGWDEVICPIDYSTEGCISDDVLNLIFGIIPSSCNVFSLIDCCHSGTMLDLKHRYKYATQLSVSEINARSLDGNIVMLSGCRDDQTSADAYMGSQYNGAMTKAFIDTLSKYKYSITYLDLLEGMRGYLQGHDFKQVPQLSSSHTINEGTVFICSRKNVPFAYTD